MTFKEFKKEYGFQAVKDVVRYEEIELYNEWVENDYDSVVYIIYAVLDTTNRSVDIEYRCPEFDLVMDDEQDMRDRILEYLM